MNDLFYKPADAWAADFIPFYWNGEYRLFYLLDWRDHERHGEGTPWYQISTRDFVHFTEHGQMLPRGTQEQQDLYVFTGSVIEANGQFHIFYTGHNPHFRKAGRPEQAVMHAVSDDLLHWRKVPEDSFCAPTARFEPHDWRDPFVFWNEEAGEWWMLLAARLQTGPSRRRGCTALCASQDLKTWEMREPFWSPGLYFTHECPDLFQMGGWWYLVFSEFSDRCVTRWRKSRSLQGPWTAPENDTFDGRAFYAAKTASDGWRRFVFGWNPTREGEKDYRPWQWGGNLVVHEIVQEANGDLSVRAPASVEAAFCRETPCRFQPRIGPCEIEGNHIQLIAPGSFACASAGPLPERCRIETTVTFAPNTRGGGLMLRADDDLEAAYYVRLEPGRNRLVFDSWPRPGDLPFMVELERPLALAPRKPVELKVFVEGTVCEVYADDRIALSARMYNLPQGDWGVFVSEGAADFRPVTLYVTQEERQE
ncbi:MAG TPA: glycoside hydrolase family 32 protein [Chthonomonadaceae bacterium]|nr:glycoside hydrolase family 32 protein [Chthonomonadaceae bacterium]